MVTNACRPISSADFGPFGRNIEPGGRIRRALREEGLEIPVVVTGGVHGFQLAEKMLRDGDADLVSAARQALADPEWFRKVHLGRGDRGADLHLNYCEGLDQKHKLVTCKLWDRLDLDAPGVKFSVDGKRRKTAPGGSRKTCLFFSVDGGLDYLAGSRAGRNRSRKIMWVCPF